METEFIQYQQALELKELGFDEPCFYQYVRDFDNDGELIPITSETNCPILRNNNQVSLCSGGDCFAAPLYQQAFRWFREKYEIDVFYWRNSLTDKYRVIDIKISNKEINLEEKFEDTEYTTYEEAEFQCIQQLIKIVKEN